MLLDIKMLKVDGIEVLRQIKADPETKLIPVAIMTSSKEEQDIIRRIRGEQLCGKTRVLRWLCQSRC
jgi:CheY-like chemotaxis protein